MLPWLDPRHFLAHCVRCGTRGAPLCRSCRALPIATAETPAGHRVSAIGAYAGYLGQCLRRLKYHDETHLAFPLGRALADLLTRSECLPRRSVLVPVPLHPARLVERGYNQSALVGRVLAGNTDSRVVTSVLLRTEQRAAQAGLSGRERRTNLLDAFLARAEERPLSRVFLVDDVVTTGSTIDACSAALARVGIEVSGVLACAIADGRPSGS